MLGTNLMGKNILAHYTGGEPTMCPVSSNNTFYILAEQENNFKS